MPSLRSRNYWKQSTANCLSLGYASKETFLTCLLTWPYWQVFPCHLSAATISHSLVNVLCCCWPLFYIFHWWVLIDLDFFNQFPPNSSGFILRVLILKPASLPKYPRSINILDIVNLCGDLTEKVGQPLSQECYVKNPVITRPQPYWRLFFYEASK